MQNRASLNCDDCSDDDKIEHSCAPLVLILLLNYRDNVVGAVRSHSLLPVTVKDGDGNDTNYYHYKDKFVKHNYDEEEGEYLCELL